MSGIHRTRIEFCDATWNPISGCLHGCPYCYASRIVKRFMPKNGEWPEPNCVIPAEHDERCYVTAKPTVLRDRDGKYLRSTPYPKGFAPTMHTYKLEYLKTARRPRKIFVGSMADIFGEWIPDAWLAAIFRECYAAPQHVYIFITKNPLRYLELAKKKLLPEGDNYWFGTTVTTAGEPFLWSREHHTFVSIEPMLSRFIGDESSSARAAIEKTDWIIMGAMTGPGAKKSQPEREWIQEIVDKAADEGGTPIFMKNSLTDIWGQPLKQEWPESMLEHIKLAKAWQEKSSCNQAREKEAIS